MRKLSLALMLALSCALVSGAQAQKKAGAAGEGKMAGGKMAGGKMASDKGGTVSISGIVKGAANGKMFTVGQKKGPIMVDGTGVQPRTKGGQFAKWDDVKGGTMVTVVGTQTGSNMKASKITINSVAGGSKKPTDKMKPAVDPKKAGAAAAPDKPVEKKGMMAKMKEKMGAMKDKIKGKMGGAKPDPKADPKKP